MSADFPFSKTIRFPTYFSKHFMQQVGKLEFRNLTPDPTCFKVILYLAKFRFITSANMRSTVISDYGPPHEMA